MQCFLQCNKDVKIQADYLRTYLKSRQIPSKPIITTISMDTDTPTTKPA